MVGVLGLSTATAPGVDVLLRALTATRAAALAAAAWAGRGDAKAADRAATDAMRAVLAGPGPRGVVVTGEGAKDDAPMLADGELLGDDDTGGYDIAVDPLECTDLCASGLPGALATIAVAPRGTLWSPGPAFYMDKLVLSQDAAGAAHVGDDPESVVAAVADALGRRTDQVRAVVLDKPRHTDLVARLRATGAAVVTPTAGDVAGALAVLLPGGGADVLLGVGGTPEGVLAACAARALGGSFEGRLAPQRDDERAALAQAGIDVDARLDLADLVPGDAAFIATGITGGLLAPPRRAHGAITTESVVIAGGAVHRLRTTTTQE